jgi:hypothetical protein
MNKLTHVKWAGPNTPYIKLTNSSRQLLLNKTELLELQKEIAEFVEFYKDSFNETNVSWEDEPWPWPPLP